MSDREQRIRERAQEIWEREGRPDGRKAEHWQMAMTEIEAEDAQGEVGAPAAPAAKPRASSDAAPLQAGMSDTADPATGRVGGPDELKQRGPLREAKGKRRGDEKG